MKDGVVGVLPALVLEAAVRFGLIFNVTVTVAIAIVVHPAQRSVDVRPDLGDRLQITSRIQVHARQHNKKRC
ncbi:hypothetical protein D3C80_1376770 [compost metagenome]